MQHDAATVHREIEEFTLTSAKVVEFVQTATPEASRWQLIALDRNAVLAVEFVNSQYIESIKIENVHADGP